VKEKVREKERESQHPACW